MAPHPCCSCCHLNPRAPIALPQVVLYYEKRDAANGPASRVQVIWTLPSSSALDDGDWHFVQLAVEFPYIGLFVDGVEHKPQFTLHRTDISSLQTRVTSETLLFPLADGPGPFLLGARFDSASGFRFPFAGELSGFTIVIPAEAGDAASTLGSRLQSCVLQCTEALSLSPASVPSALTLEAASDSLVVTGKAGASLADYQAFLAAVRYTTGVPVGGRAVSFGANGLPAGFVVQVTASGDAADDP